MGFLGKTAGLAKNFGANAIKALNLNEPFRFLGSSTYWATMDFEHLQLGIKDGKTFYTSLLDNGGGTSGYLIGTMLSAGRTMIATAGNLLGALGYQNDWDKRIADVRSISLGAYLAEINKASFPMAFLLAAPAYIDAFTNVASGAAQIYALSNPKKFAAEFFEAWNILKKHDIVGQSSQLAGGGEWGTIFWSMLGTVAGFKYNAKIVRETTNAPESVTIPLTDSEGRAYRVAKFATPQVITKGGRTASLTWLRDNWLTGEQRLGHFFAGQKSRQPVL